MLVSRKWLNQLVDIETIENEDLAEILTQAGLEVEGIRPMASGTNLEIGLVLSCEKHPESDHLSITQVELSDGVYQIVCGAPNVASGQKVIVARVGAKLVGGEIKEAKVRNVLSSGMICSLEELNVPAHVLEEKDQEGIAILDDSAKIGEDPLAFLGLDDVIFDIALTPNRADLMSLQSLAYEVAALTGAKLNTLATLEDPHVDPTQFTIDSTTPNCTQFLAKVINHVVVKESPMWIKQALRGSGMNPINNIVDISNLVMLETGQPSHFYDKRYFKDHLEITVRDDIEAEVVGLDGETYQLELGDTVITSKGEPIGIAGIKGLGNSMIVEDTTAIVIELASFLPVPIRKTARRLNMHSESSLRYSKPMDPLAPQKAMQRILYLLASYAQMDDEEMTVTYPKVISAPTEKTIQITPEKINKVLGSSYTPSEIVEVFENLRLKPQVHNQHILCRIPSDRLDLVIEEDLIEEVIRFKGFDSIPSTLPTLPSTRGQLTLEQKLRRKAASILVSSGIYEVVTYTLISQTMADQPLALSPRLQLINPLSEARQVIRGDLSASLLKLLEYNLNMKNEAGLYFEISKVYQQNSSQWRLGIVGSHHLGSLQYQDVHIQTNYGLIKGLIEKLLSGLGINLNRLSFIANTKDTQTYHPHRSAEILLDHKPLGILGEVHPQKIDKAVLAEINLSQIIASKRAKVNYKPLSRYPRVSRDIALLVDPEITHDQIVRTIKKGGGRLLTEVVLFDIFQLPNKKSMAYRLTFESFDHTLSENEIHSSMESILSLLKDQLGASLRTNQLL